MPVELTYSLLGDNDTESFIKDAVRVIEGLRDEDREELEILKFTIDEHLHTMANGRFFFCIYEGDKPVAIMGVSDRVKDDPLNEGIVWLLCTNDVKSYPIAFYKTVKHMVETYGFFYKILYNFIPTSSKNNINFVQSLGFVVDERTVIEILNMDYYRFSMITPRGLEESYYVNEEKQDA